MSTKSDLSLLVNPNSVAIVGASDRAESIGGRVVENLLQFSSFSGTTYLVNATRDMVAGQPCWPSVAELPETPDVIVVAVPAAHVLQVLTEAGERGVRFAIILSSGFGEAGEEGKAVEQEMRDLVQRTGIRLYGPNCPGLVNINQKLGFTFSPSFRHDLNSGPVGLVTQGGGLGRNVMQAMTRGFGVGLWASTGNEVDLQVADFIEYMAKADDIQVIVTLIEGIKDGRRFMEALKTAADHGKPVIGLKVGRSEYGQKAAQSHTASITGVAEVNSAMFRQMGLIEVDDIDELIDTAWLFARFRPTATKGLAIYCSSGGTAALSADMVGVAGLTLAQFGEQTASRLNSKLPAYAATGNPVDTTTAILSDPDLVDETMLAVAQDDAVSLVLLPITLDYGATTVSVANSAVRVQKQINKPILPIWMTDRMGDAFQIYAQAGMMPARSVGKAIKAIGRWQAYETWRQQRDASFVPLLMTMSKTDAQIELPRALTEVEGKQWLARAGVAVPDIELCTSEEQAVAAAQRIGFPVVAKVVSEVIQHKSDIGGVQINLSDENAVRQAWRTIQDNVKKHAPDVAIDGILIERMYGADGVEVIVGVSRDPVLGHVMMFGLGGIYVELFKDVSRSLLPLTDTQADRMIQEIKSYPILSGARGRALMDIDALKKLMLALSDAIVANPELIEEVDVNPVWVGPKGQGAVALDALVIGNFNQDTLG
ncbi:acetate--CoA ligase family protein [Orrella sp. 11846]|uniref:acetate--CoA ligase family protein n=1 Tax=Orrella sp. 11846 TaxID=3409913 RepID=UPI003B5C28E3